MLLWSPQIQAKRCDGEGIEVLMSCLDSISKEMPHPPTPIKGCCTVVQTIGMNCVCEVITKELEALIDMQKLVNLAATCGRPLAPRSHCGSKSQRNPLVLFLVSTHKLT